MYKNNFVVCLKIKDGEILRDDNGIIKIPFDTEYSIYLKNLNSKKAKVEISIDGEDVFNKNSIVVKENDISEIKGFLEGNKVKNAFKFIEKIKEISDYRGNKIDDGLIRVKITYEKEKVEIPYYKYFPQIDYIPQQPLVWYSNDSHNDFCEVYCSNNINNNINFEDAKLKLQEDQNNRSIQQLRKDKNIAEGITMHGSPINQELENAYIGQLEENSTVIVLKLTGYKDDKKKVTEPITVKTKNQCPTCGKMCKSSAKYCDRCGTCLI